jgi:hypothetical protein
MGEYKEVYRGRAEEAHAIMRLLLQHGGNPNETSLHPGYGYDRYCEVTALSESVGHEDIEGMKILLDAGADVHKKSAGGKTPLRIAADRTNLEAVNLLLRHGANPNVKGKDDETPLEYAKVIGAPQVIIDALLNAEQR